MGPDRVPSTSHEADQPESPACRHGSSPTAQRSEYGGIEYGGLPVRSKYLISQHLAWHDNNVLPSYLLVVVSSIAADDAARP